MASSTRPSLIPAVGREKRVTPTINRILQHNTTDAHTPTACTRRPTDFGDFGEILELQSAPRPENAPRVERLATVPLTMLSELADLHCPFAILYTLSPLFHTGCSICH